MGKGHNNLVSNAPQVALQIYNPDNPKLKMETSMSVELLTPYSTLTSDIIERLRITPYGKISLSRLNGELEHKDLYHVGLKLSDFSLCSTPCLITEECTLGRVTLYQLGLTIKDNSLTKLELIGLEDVVFQDFIVKWLPTVYKSMTQMEIARNTYEEIIQYYNDLLDLLKEIQVERRCFDYAIVVIAYPQAASLISSFLSGALNLCGLPIRLTLEATAAGFYADKINYRKGEDVHTRLRKMLNKIRKKGSGFKKFCEKELKNQISEELMMRIVKLWSDTSREWLHPIGIIRGLEKISYPSDIPSMIVGPFLAYTDADQRFLSLLQKQVKELREILRDIKSELTYIL